MTRGALVLAVVAACGGRTPTPKGPPRVDTDALAAELDAEQAELAAILHRDRANCPALATNLEALYPKLTATFARARDAQRDPEVARQLTSALKRYDAAAAARSAAMEADLTPDAPCVHDPAVRDALMAMPTL